MRADASTLLVRALALTPIGRAYQQVSGASDALDFAVRSLRELDVRMAIEEQDVSRIPASGPLVVVANHPFGALDGLLVLSLLARVRSDVKLIGNHLLQYIPALRPNLLPVEIFDGRRHAIHRNGMALRQARRWLDRGGALVVFPAGEVAHLRGASGNASDSPWRPAVAALAVQAGASVLPIFIAGSNSRLFRAVGRVHPLLRTALLPREMWAMRGRTIAVTVGRSLAPGELEAAPDARARTALLRAAVERPGTHTAPEAPAAVAAVAPVAVRGPAEAIRGDIAALQHRLLVESGSFQVFCAPALELPAVLPEIGRLREVAFRSAGEGTGMSRDLDRFDRTYEHLFVWDRSREEIVGAYRLGATDVVAAGGRVDGLYTRTLFDYDSSLLREIGPALELGRAFVQPSYQRDFSPLLLLWKGIARVVARSGRYRRLFGVVSISDRYQSTSRQLLVKFLQTHTLDTGLAGLVRARHEPPRGEPVEAMTVSSVEQMSSVIRALEPDGKDIPVLLRQYLKLNAKLLGFTVDQQFGNVIDGLMVVDLADVAPAILARFMGRVEAASLQNTMRLAS